jgi:DNA-binding response OmpR family regulator
MCFGPKNRILVVDDDSDMLLLIKRFLSENIYHIEEAKNSKECIEKAKKFSPDVIIIDALMPELESMATVLKLRSDEETKSIPIIMCTAVKERQDPSLIPKFGAIDYVTKTPQMSDLLDKIERVLNQ